MKPVHISTQQTHVQHQRMGYSKHMRNTNTYKYNTHTHTHTKHGFYWLLYGTDAANRASHPLSRDRSLQDEGRRTT